MLPSILAKQLEKGIGDYLETTFPMTNAPFRDSLKKMLATKDSLYQEPYISVRLPFRVADSMPDYFQALHPQYLPYVHQQKAYERLMGNDGRSTLIATGTGSGKTECFQYPILEYCYAHRGERGIKALIIYPMNALATDQAKRFAELVHTSPELRGNVTVGMYVGGFGGEKTTAMSEQSVINDRVTILNNPPDILLTNYKMLDYLLVRPSDTDLWADNTAETLKYIAVDELHTFDGAQGTDLACLLRRLKSRLAIQPGYLCCIGTSATMGGEGSAESIREYAAEIFGEPFEKNAVITEDRLSPQEFFAESEITDFGMPTAEQVMALEQCVAQDDEQGYLTLAAASWLTDFAGDLSSDEGRLSLGEHLMHHSFLQTVISLMNGNYYQEPTLVEELKVQYPALLEMCNVGVALDALFALVSYARTGSVGSLRPFLTVQVQLWIRELRRLLGKVSRDEKVTYAIAHDLNEQQAKQYLPVVNCRDCGATGWVSILNERQNATITNLNAFYNRYFSCDDKVIMMFPDLNNERPYNTMPGRLCPDCLQVFNGEGVGEQCRECGADTVPVYIPLKPTVGSGEGKRYVCPCCGSRSGLSLMGLRSATEISASISQLFASKFNDDKKTLAFSDNVQDAAHRAGFFNARTWKFGLRSAMQRYVQHGGDGQSLGQFIKGFIAYWHQQLSDEDFVSSFIAPNMTWMGAYERMLAERKLERGKAVEQLMADIERRLSYEIIREYGNGSHVGRTLQKSACSCLSFAETDIEAVAERMQERIVNELSLTTQPTLADCRLLALGFLEKMRAGGAIADPVFNAFLQAGGKNYLLSNDYLKWLPGVHGGANAPHFLAVTNAKTKKKLWNFDLLSSYKYAGWVEDVLMAGSILPGDNAPQIARLILEELVRLGLVSTMDIPADYAVYGLNKNKVYVTSEVMTLKCEVCGTFAYVAAENAADWEQAPCARRTCAGAFVRQEHPELSYYNKLFSNGDLFRINAREHTGLLQKGEREAVENDFKRDREQHQLWDPNVLSCTPTLEMGIDIGDLSTVILCSMPPAQSQFLQRAGRAGRKDGNALTLAVANARPHDLYFYADPLDMISGKVDVPKIFLRASAVLERQFVAYCMDSWVKKGVPEKAIPPKVGVILDKFKARPDDMFPFNFLHYVQNNLTSRLNSFLQMFAEYIDESTEEELRTFARGSGVQESPMAVKIYDAFDDLKARQDSLRKNIQQLKDMVKELEAKPKDSSYEDEIKELNYEMAALVSVRKSMQEKNVFSFLSDEGLLPNYAFPEAGVILKAVLWRKEEESDTGAKNRFVKKVYEYSRSASTAISEFAPNNNFYVDGRKLKIDQVDMSSAKMEPWRLCPNCSHADHVKGNEHAAACPQCGSPAWADAGQIRNMLRVQMVYSNMDATKSTIADDSDDRSATFYTKQLLVDVDEQHDILSAYHMHNPEFDFGYEFVRKATMREINFGETDTVGEKMVVAGNDGVKKGFRICKYCGKVQPEKGKPEHTRFCKTRKFPNLEKEATEQYLYLYREFQTEILRLLIPATTMDSSDVRTESFVAAFMLGLKQYFGNVDHLRVTISEVPVPDADYRKQYLVIYDSVPGGTGYLKQLMQEKDEQGKKPLLEVLSKALQVMENCSCNRDDQKDGCYHCLYTYRRNQQIGSISRRAAVSMLKAILSSKDKLEKIDCIGNIPVNRMFDSELERRFVEALAAMGNDTRQVSVETAWVNNVKGYLLKVNDKTWEVEPQHLLDTTDGVSVQCKPDFILWPVTDADRMPVAIFTDGFIYHKDKVADDTLKREAIRRSGQYRVWALSWKDVQAVFQVQDDYATDVLSPEKMPNGSKMYQPTVNAAGAADITPAKMTQMEMLLRYLYLERAEEQFCAQARAYALSLLEPAKLSESMDFEDWNRKVAEIESEAIFSDETIAFPGTFFGKWIPRAAEAQLTLYGGVQLSALKADRQAPVLVCSVLEDRQAHRSEKYEAEWNAFWHLFNIMQFNPKFIAVSEMGLQQMVYMVLKDQEDSAPVAEKTAAQDEAWAETLEYIFDEQAKQDATRFQAAGIPAPEEAGYELADESGEVVATIELAWLAVKVCYLTEEQLPDREKLEALGWRIISAGEELTADWFGGKA